MRIILELTCEEARYLVAAVEIAADTHDGSEMEPLAVRVLGKVVAAVRGEGN